MVRLGQVLYGHVCRCVVMRCLVRSGFESLSFIKKIPVR